MVTIKRVLGFMILASLLCSLCCGCMVKSENHSLDDYLESEDPLTMDFTIFPAKESVDEASVEAYLCIEKSTRQNGRPPQSKS